ncbi:hypothetical protein COOONC_00147 [Cooperia oncophora]
MDNETICSHWPLSLVATIIQDPDGVWNPNIIPPPAVHQHHAEDPTDSNYTSTLENISKRTQPPLHHFITFIPSIHSTSYTSTLWKHWLTVALAITWLQSTHPLQTSNTHLNCITGEVCENDHCIEINDSDQILNVYFPHHFTRYSVLRANTVQLLSQMVSNPECWPRIAIAVTAILLYISAITAYICLESYTNFSASSPASADPLHPVHSSPFSDGHREHDARPTVNNKWTTKTIIRLIVIFTCLIIPAHGCQQTVLLPTPASQCDPSNNNCHNQTTVIIPLNQMQPDVCLQLKHGNKQIHFMRISMDKLILRCREETSYLTRNTLTNVQYKKRCPHMGTCSVSTPLSMDLQRQTTSQESHIVPNPVEA